VAIRSKTIIAHLLTGWALEGMVVIAEIILNVANLVRLARRIILAEHPAFPLRKARLRSVVACLVSVARFDHRVRTIGKTEVCFGIAPEVITALVIRIARA
jgi:hypothetical protein